MAANQMKCSRLEQKYVIKFLLTEKYKPCEIYIRINYIYDVYKKKKSFNKKFVKNGLNIGL